ncbi:hypothetical protein IFM89_015322, partial [Coptis chinensis]
RNSCGDNIVLNAKNLSAKDVNRWFAASISKDSYLLRPKEEMAQYEVANLLCFKSDARHSTNHFCGASGIGWSFPPHVESFDAMWSVTWATSIHKELMTKVRQKKKEQAKLDGEEESGDSESDEEEEIGEADEEEEKEEGETGEVDEKGEADEKEESKSDEVDEKGEVDEEEKSKSNREEEEKKESDGKEEKGEADGEEEIKLDGEEENEETKSDGEEESGDTKSDEEDEEKGDGEPNSMFKKVKERERMKKTSTIYEFGDIKKQKRKTKVTEPVIDVDDFETPLPRAGTPMSKPHSNKLWKLLDKEKMSLVENFFKNANQNTITWMDIQTHLEIQGEQLNHMMLNFFISDKIIDWYVHFHLPKEVVKLIGCFSPKSLYFSSFAW